MKYSNDPQKRMKQIQREMSGGREFRPKFYNFVSFWIGLLFLIGAIFGIHAH